jgi:HTH-type transcriptional regulator / antitoxin HigA
MKATKNNQSLPSFSKLPKSYAALCAILMPRIIHDNAEHHAVTEIIDLMAGRNLSNDQADYLETLSELSEAYETQNLPDTPKTTPHAFLAAHLSNIGMNFTEWGKLIGIDRSTASRIIRGERKLNTTHIRKTADALKIDAGLLI